MASIRRFEDIEAWQKARESTKKLIAGSMKYLRVSEIRGLKFKTGDRGGRQPPTRD